MVISPAGAASSGRGTASTGGVSWLTSDRLVPAEGDALDQAMLPGEVTDDRVLRRPVVPEPEIARLPVVPHRELGLGGVLVQEREQRLALVGRQPLDVGGEAGIDEQGAAPRLRMGPHHRMLDGSEVEDLLPFPLTPLLAALQQAAEDAAAV